MSTRFREGMKVKVVQNLDYPGHRIGELGVVKRVDKEGGYPLWVEMDDGEEVPWKEVELEIVDASVVVIEGEVVNGYLSDGDYDFFFGALYPRKRVRVTVEEIGGE